MESAVQSFAAMSLDGRPQSARVARGLIVTDLLTGDSHFEESGEAHSPPGSIEGTANCQNQSNPFAFDYQTGGVLETNRERELCLDNETYFRNQATFREDQNPTDLSHVNRRAIVDLLSHMPPRSQAHRAITSIVTYGLPGDEYDPDIKKQAAESAFAESEQGTAFFGRPKKLKKSLRSAAQGNWGLSANGKYPQMFQEVSSEGEKPKKSMKAKKPKGSKKASKSTKAGSTVQKTRLEDLFSVTE
jgi:hypothetical protein